MTNKHDRDILLDIGHTQLFNYNCTITPYEDRPQVFQCSKCGMFSHCTASCKQPRCLLCGSKTHDTEEHPQEEKLTAKVNTQATTKNVMHTETAWASNPS